jgi:DNA-binding transcriptional LysR family regulator
MAQLRKGMALAVGTWAESRLAGQPPVTGPAESVNLFRLTRLRHFCAVAQHGSVGVAARALHLSQPALTRSIRKIEQDVGEALFERSAAGMRLNATGSALLPYAMAILAEADRGIQEYRNLKGERHTRLKVGMSANFGAYILPDVLQRFYQEYPNSQVDVQTGHAEQLVAQLLGAQIDLALLIAWGGALDKVVGRTAELLAENLRRLPAGPYAPSSHPLAHRQAVSLQELQSQQWMIPHGLNINWIFQGRFTGRGLDPPSQLLTTVSLELLITSSLRLGAMTMLPRHLVRGEVEAGRMRPIDCPDLALEYDIALAMRRRGSRTPAMAYFAQLLREACNEVPDDRDDARQRPRLQSVQPR